MEDRVVEALFMSTTDTSIPEPDDGTWASGTGRWHDIDPVEEVRMLRPSRRSSRRCSFSCVYTTTT
jgi:hypothetical protein